MTSAAIRLEEFDIASRPDELAPGTQLLRGQFTIDSFLNAGGFGITYLARDSLDRRVVIKECFPASFCRRVGVSVVPRSLQRQEKLRSVVKLFLQEAYTLARLNHPNIVKVFQVFEDNDTAYMAMEYIQGPDLLETVEGKSPPLRPAQIVDILDQLLDALGYVHAEGFLHRDISPDNILLDQATARPVLIDFGASRKDVTRKSRAISGLRVVKDGYSPQEFYITGSTQAPCSDLYALAATFRHLITREAPHTSQERLSSIANRQGDTQPPLLGQVKGYTSAMLQAIDKAMAIFPRDRLQSVAEWQAMLRGDGTAPVVRKDVAMFPAPIAAAAETSHSKASVPAAADMPDAGLLSSARSFLAIGRPRDLLVSSAAAVLLLVGLVSLAGDVAEWIRPVASTQPAATAGAALPIGQIVELANGMVFKIVPTAAGAQTVVAELPEGVVTDLQVGDVLLVYVATGETLGSETALVEILGREMTNKVATYSFAVQRKGTMTVGKFELPGLG